MSNFIENGATHINWIVTEIENLNKLENEKIREFVPTLNRLSNMIANHKIRDRVTFFGREGFTVFRDHVIKLLDERNNNIKIKDISESCGFSSSWLNQLASGLIGNPGVNNLEVLYYYLTGKKIMNLDDHSVEFKPDKKLESNWLNDTKFLLNDIVEDQVVYAKICKDCNVSIEWLMKFKSGLLLSPSITKVNAVNIWLKKNT